MHVKVYKKRGFVGESRVRFPHVYDSNHPYRSYTLKHLSSQENKDKVIQFLHTSVQETKTLKIEVSVEDEPRSKGGKHQRKFPRETDQIL